MNRYFIEVSYKGTNFTGFQIQDNTETIQGEINKTLETYFRIPFTTTTSSRTDSGVHAIQNFLHTDTEVKITAKDIYHCNAIIHNDIVIKNITQVHNEAHSRFDAISRRYEYKIYQHKNPFLQDTAYFFPFPIDIDTLQNFATCFLGTHNFESFAKRNTDVLNYQCTIHFCSWKKTDFGFIFTVEANRFLRGMVRSIVATMLKAATKKYSTDYIHDLLSERNTQQAFFDSPAHGLHLMEIKYPDSVFLAPL